MRSKMKMVVVTTITTMLDVDTMVPEHSIDIDDRDGLHEVSSQVLGAVLINAMNSARVSVAEKFGVELLSQDETKDEEN